MKILQQNNSNKKVAQIVTINETPFLITNVVLNGNNSGSQTSNKQFHICYACTENNLKKRTKKLIGCYVNPYDPILEKEEKNRTIDKYIHYFQIYLSITKLFNIKELLKYTEAKTYSNHIVKQILTESSDITTKKIIAKCVEELKKRYE